MPIRAFLILSIGAAMSGAPASAQSVAASEAAANPASSAAAAAATSAPFGAAEIETAGFSGDLPAGRSALTAKVQLLLDRAGISPGVVDGWRGGMSESAIMAFQRREGLPANGVLTQSLWDLLLPYAQTPLTQDYTITTDDLSDLVVEIPRDYALMAQMSHLGFTSLAEKLGERFHMDEKFLRFLNPEARFMPGETIKVMAPAKRIRGAVTRIIVDKQTRRVAAYDASGKLIADYPATVGSDQMPSPSGTHTVDAVALNPTYHYNPRINRQQGTNDKALVLPPGPNGPVGTVWIDLSKPTYGIHGTSTPSRLFKNQSSGCVRLTNWDAAELAGMVQSGVTSVEFLDPGISIADVTGTSAAASPATTHASTAADTPGGTPDIAEISTSATVPADQAVGSAVLDTNGAGTGIAPGIDQAAPDPLSEALDGLLPETATTSNGNIVTSPAQSSGG